MGSSEIDCHGAPEAGDVDPWCYVQNLIKIDVFRIYFILFAAGISLSILNRIADRVRSFRERPN
jgi:hypothetical protein